MPRTINYGSEYWRLHEDGAIERPGLVKPNASTWRVLKAVEYNNFGNVVRVYPLSQILADPASIPWQFKNGSQRTYIRDFDHGTTREWRSPRHRVAA